MYTVGKVSVPVASATLGSESVANHLLETCERVIVCFMIGFSSVEHFGWVPLGGSLWADVCNVALKSDNASSFTNYYTLCVVLRGLGMC